MERLTIEEIVDHASGQLVMGDPAAHVTGISIDSRTCGKGDLFIAIVGGNHDAHDYIKDVYKSGCRSFLISDERVITQVGDGNVILVQDTVKAMQSIAYHYLRKIDPIRIAVTGSVGKTSARDMVYYIMSSKYNTVRPDKNYNNEIGVPLTIFSLKARTEAVVFEEGLERAGDIHRLSAITRPNACCITNVGVSHLMNFGSRKELAKAKMEVADFLTPDGVLVLNTDNDLLSEEKDGKIYKVVTVGSADGSDYRISDIEDKGAGGVSFTVSCEDGEERVHLPVPGAHNAVNAGLAIAVCRPFGIGLDDAAKALSGLELTGDRLKVDTARGITVIDDSYNAAPASMKSAIETLMNTEGKRHVAILAGMNELGDDSEKYHRETGEFAAKAGVDILITSGEKAEDIADGAAQEGGPEVIKCGDNTEVCRKALDFLEDGDVVLTKGSNAYHMNEVAQNILKGKVDNG